jgi:hypothetical protein
LGLRKERLKATGGRYGRYIEDLGGWGCSFAPNERVEWEQVAEELTSSSYVSSILLDDFETTPKRIFTVK